MALQFKEPMMSEKEVQSSVKKHFKQCLTIMKVNRRLLAMLLYFPLIMTLGTVIYFYAQAYFSELSYSRSAIALIFLRNGLFSVLGALLADKIETWCKGKAWFCIPLGMSIAVFFIRVV